MPTDVVSSPTSADLSRSAADTDAHSVSIINLLLDDYVSTALSSKPAAARFKLRCKGCLKTFVWEGYVGVYSKVSRNLAMTEFFVTPFTK